MQRTQKLLILSTLLFFLLGCSLTNLVKEKIAGETAAIAEGVSNSDPEAQPSSPEAQPSSGGQAAEPSDGEKAPFNVYIPTEVKLVDSVLNISQYVTLNDQAAGSYKSYFVLENTSSDSADQISEFTYKITWYDESGQEVDVWENTYNSTDILPQEKVLFYLYPDRSKTEGRQIASTVFEVLDVTTVQSFADAEWLAKLASLPITHPIVSTNPGEFTFDYFVLLFDPIPRVTASVQIQSALSVESGVEVVGLFLNANGDLIGIGKSDPVVLAAGGSATAEVVGYDMSEEPSQVEYFVEIVSPYETFMVAYPGMFN